MEEEATRLSWGSVGEAHADVEPSRSTKRGIEVLRMVPPCQRARTPTHVEAMSTQPSWLDTPSIALRRPEKVTVLGARS